MTSPRFIDKETGQFNAEKYTNEIEKRVKGNMTVDEVAELWAMRNEVDYIQSQRSNCNNTVDNRRPKTASFEPSQHVYDPHVTSANRKSRRDNNTWFLDMFDNPSYIPTNHPSGW